MSGEGNTEGFQHMHKDGQRDNALVDGSFDRDIKAVEELSKYDEVPRALEGFRLMLCLNKDARVIEYRTGKRNGPVIHTTTERLVAMNGPAAGHRTSSPFYHGRVGAGITIAFDLVLSR
jgi:hypothetical protein